MNTQGMYDISMSLCDQTPVWPSNERFKLRWLKNIKNDGVNESSLSFNTHTGTHIDLPYHFIESGQRVNNLSLERLIGKTLVAEYEGKSDIDKNLLSKIDISEDCNKLIFKTQNSKKYLEKNRFRKDYVALSLDGARWIIENGIDLVGIDYLSIEAYFNKENETHKLLLENNVIILEGIVLNNVKEGYYNLIALPLNILEAEAAPVRAALYKEGIL